MIVIISEVEMKPDQTAFIADGRAEPSNHHTIKKMIIIKFKLNSAPNARRINIDTRQSKVILLLNDWKTCRWDV